jgi:hypothetical protein
MAKDSHSLKSYRQSESYPAVDHVAITGAGGNVGRPRGASSEAVSHFIASPGKVYRVVRESAAVAWAPEADRKEHLKY